MANHLLTWPNIQVANWKTDISAVTTDHFAPLQVSSASCVFFELVTLFWCVDVRTTDTNTSFLRGRAWLAFFELTLREIPAAAGF